MARDRKKPKKRRWLRRTIVWSLVAGLLTAGGVALAHSSLFALDGIDVRGAHYLSRDDVVAASGLRLGMNVLSVDGGAVTARLKKIPLVGAVRVERIYPSKVRMIIRERTPAGVALTTSGPWLVGSDGSPITPAPLGHTGLPVVSVLGVIGSEGLDEGMRLWGAMPAWARRQTIWLNALDPTKIFATFAGARVIFGSADDLGAKLAALTAVFQRARTTGVRVVSLDLRAPSRPAAVLR